jgi:hypothetical protein
MRVSDRTAITDKTRREALRIFDMMDNSKLMEALSILPPEILPKYQAGQFTESLARDQERHDEMFAAAKPRGTTRPSVREAKSMLEYGLEALAAPAPKGGRIGGHRIGKAPDQTVTMRESQNPALHIVHPKAPKIDSHPEILDALEYQPTSNNDNGGAGRDSR